MEWQAKARGLTPVLLGMALVLPGCIDSSRQPADPVAPMAAAKADSAAPKAQVETPAVVTQPPAASGPAATPVVDAMPAVADASTTDVDRNIDAVLGDHKAYRDVFDRLKRGMAAGDKEAVAALVKYPIKVSSGGKRRTIRNAKEFVASWDKIVTPEVERAVAGQKFADVLVNATNGVMIGDGQVWINGVCSDNACSTSEVGVVAIQSVAPR